MSNPDLNSSDALVKDQGAVFVPQKFENIIATPPISASQVLSEALATTPEKVPEHVKLPILVPMRGGRHLQISRRPLAKNEAFVKLKQKVERLHTPTGKTRAAMDLYLNGAQKFSPRKKRTARKKKLPLHSQLPPLGSEQKPEENKRIRKKRMPAVPKQKITRQYDEDFYPYGNHGIVGVQRREINWELLGFRGDDVPKRRPSELAENNSVKIAPVDTEQDSWMKLVLVNFNVGSPRPNKNEGRQSIMQALRAANQIVAEDIEQKAAEESNENVMPIDIVFDAAQDRPEYAQEATTIQNDEAKNYLKYVFELYDKDGSGSINSRELFNVLEDLGMAPKSEFQRATMDNLITKFDTDNSDSLEFLEFVNMLNAFYDEQYWRVFWEHDEDKSGSIDKNELNAALAELGILVDAEALDKLLCEYDSDESGELQYMEFVGLLTAIQEGKLQEYRQCAGFEEKDVTRFKKVFTKYDPDDHGTISLGEVIPAFNQLHILPTLEKDQEHLLRHLCGRDTTTMGHLDFQEFLMFVRYWMNHSDRMNTAILTPRSLQKIQDGIFTQWLTRKSNLREFEIITIRKIFDVHDWNKAGIILRKDVVGLCQDIDLGQEAIAAVEEACEEHSEEKMFSLFDVVQMLSSVYSSLYKTNFDLLKESSPRRPSTQHLMKQFESNREAGKLEKMKVSKLKTAWNFVNQVPTSETEKKIAEQLSGNKQCDLDFLENEITFEDFLEIMKDVRESHLKNWNKRAGFEVDEIKKLRKKFHAFDDNGNGELDGLEVRNLFISLGRIPKTHEDQKRMQAMIRSIDDDKNNAICFDEFLQLVRVLTNEDQRKRFDAERKAAEEAGFSKQERESFRELFHEMDKDQSNSVSHNELVTFVRARMGLNLDQSGEVKKLIARAVTKTKRELNIKNVDKSDEDEGCCFQDFLYLMRDLLALPIVSKHVLANVPEHLKEKPLKKNISHVSQI